MGDWRDRATCRGDPEGWDLDYTGTRIEEVWKAAKLCQECPVLAECEAWTKSLPKPERQRGVIQHGMVYPSDGRPAYNPTIKECPRGHLRTPDNLTKGMCKICNKERAAAKRAAKATSEQEAHDEPS